MTKPFLVFCLLLLAAGADAAPLSLTLPNADSYAYWVQSESGSIGTMPVNVTHKKAVQITAPMTTGDQLLVLDAHTGEVASHKISIGLSGAPLPITLAVSDFQPISAPVPALAVPAASPVSAPPQSSGIARLLTGLFSLVLAGGVCWLVLHLVRTRGEPLRDLARRAGVEIPDPAALTEDADTEKEPPVYASEKRAPEVIPEEAGLPPSEHSARLGRGPELALTGIPALLGLQGLAAGSTFALTDGDVTVGRDGDNEIVLAENTVSRRHARLVRDGHGQFTLTDLGSANGVYINGTRIQRAILSTGDEIKIGDNYFRFQAARETL
ncbi:MAG: FHA domain-containing protein [Janthinobacterium lividum]